MLWRNFRNNDSVPARFAHHSDKLREREDAVAEKNVPTVRTTQTRVEIAQMDFFHEWTEFVPEFGHHLSDCFRISRQAFDTVDALGPLENVLVVEYHSQVSTFHSACKFAKRHGEGPAMNVFRTSLVEVIRLRRFTDQTPVDDYMVGANTTHLIG